MSPAGRPAEAACDDLHEADLVARARRGAREAFRVMVQRSNQRLFRVARGAVRDDGIAEDVPREIYSKALAGLDGYGGEAALHTWLTRITLNEVRGRRSVRRQLCEALNGTVASALQGALPFLGSRCLRATGAVPERLAPRYGWHADARPNGGTTTETKQ